VSRILVCSIALLCLSTPVTAQAETTDEAVMLLESAASGDSGALERARRIESIDRVPVNMAALLEAVDADPTRAAEILRAGVIVDPGPEVAEAAASILSQERFSQASSGSLERWLDRIGSWIADRLARLSGGNGSARRANVLAITAVLALVALAAAVATKRRAAVVHERITLDRLIEQEGADPVLIEREAMIAAAAGDYARSIRLRFVAGILRLDQQGVIHYTKGLTTGEIARAVDDPVFLELQVDFDRVVYGDQPADHVTEQRSESGWRRLLEEVRQR
jgi:hypothetical protein